MMRLSERPSARAAVMYSKFRPAQELRTHDTHERRPVEEQQHASNVQKPGTSTEEMMSST